MQFNRFELIGGAVSVACLALALWLVRVETTNQALSQSVGENQTAAVYVTGDNESDLRAAFSEAAGDGQLSRMVIDDVVVGAGDAVEVGDVVTVNYKGMLQNGQEFDNSYTRGEPITFEVGAGRVIAGWEEGIVGMHVGGQRILVIPPALAYGSDGYGPIPGNATLVFTVELLSIE